MLLQESHFRHRELGELGELRCARQDLDFLMRIDDRDPGAALLMPRLAGEAYPLTHHGDEFAIDALDLAPDLRERFGNYGRTAAIALQRMPDLLFRVIDGVRHRKVAIRGGREWSEP